MKSSFIDISEIFQKHFQILDLKHSSSNRWIFIFIPIIVGVACSFIFNQWTDSVLNIFVIVLSIFVPLFMNLLVLLITTIINKIQTRHNKERVELIKQIFYNICYLIPVSLILISLLLLLGIKPFQCFELINYKCVSISWYQFYVFFIGIFFYSGFIHLTMTILMITKRIFKLFDKEIDLLSNNQNEKQ
jgi:hypothetical protein